MNINTDTDELSRLCDLASSNAVYWKNVCDEINRLFDGQGTIFLPGNPDFRGVWTIQSDRLSNVTNEYIQNNFHLIDFRQKGMELIYSRGYFTDDDLIERSEMAHNPYYGKWLIPHGLGFAIVFRLDTPTDTFVISVQFEHDRPPISKEEIELIRKVQATVSKSSFAADENFRIRFSDFASLVSENSSTVCVLDINTTICQEHIGCKIGPFKNEIGLFALLPTPVETKIKKMCSCHPDEIQSFKTQFESDATAYDLNAFQLPRTIRHFHILEKVMVVISPSEYKTHTVGDFQADYTLTDSEIALIELLSKGSKVAAIADLTGVKESTARQKLKAIFSKVGVNTQAQLVAKFLG